jgi:hypothetical protein
VATKTIHTLAYKLMMDTNDLKQGAVATRRELSSAKRVMRETRTPAEALENQIKELNAIFKKGAIDQETYNRKLKQLEGSYKAAQAQGGKLARVQKGLTAAIFNAKNLMGVLAGAAVVRGIGRQIDQIDALAKAARKLDVSTEFLTRLQFAAGQTIGLTDEQTVAAIEKMSINLNKAEHETGRAKLILDKYNISLRALVRQNPQATLFAVADAMKRVKDETDRNVIAGAIFGETQSGMHVLLQQTNEELLNQFNRADQLGKTLRTVDATQMEKAKDAMGEMEAVFGNFSRTFAVTVGPTLIAIMQELTAILERLKPSEDAGGMPSVTRRTTFGDTMVAMARTAGQNLDVGGENFLDPLKLFKNLDDVTRDRIATESQAWHEEKQRRQERGRLGQERQQTRQQGEFAQYEKQEDMRHQREQAFYLRQLYNMQRNQQQQSAARQNREPLRPENTPVRLE